MNTRNLELIRREVLSRSLNWTDFPWETSPQRDKFVAGLIDLRDDFSLVVDWPDGHAIPKIYNVRMRHIRESVIEEVADGVIAPEDLDELKNVDWFKKKYEDATIVLLDKDAAAKTTPIADIFSSRLDRWMQLQIDRAAFELGMGTDGEELLYHDDAEYLLAANEVLFKYTIIPQCVNNTFGNFDFAFSRLTFDWDNLSTSFTNTVATLAAISPKSLSEMEIVKFSFNADRSVTYFTKKKAENALCGYICEKIVPYIFKVTIQSKLMQSKFPKGDPILEEEEKRKLLQKFAEKISSLYTDRELSI